VSLDWISESDFGNTDIAPLENAILCQQALRVIADLQERMASAQISLRTFGGRS
jgi:hypothetical protein